MRVWPRSPRIRPMRPAARRIPGRGRATSARSPSSQSFDRARADVLDVHGGSDPVVERLEALDGHARFGQRCMTSPTGRTTSALQSGQRFGIRHGFEPGSCSPAGPTTCGITSPARWTITRSPLRMSLRRMSSSLWSVALDTVTPPTWTARARPGVEDACAADADVDLEEARHRRRRGPLEGAREARTPCSEPRRSCWSNESTLTTIPSISYERSAAHLHASHASATASIVRAARRSGS